jgi:hypothetical protein
VAGAVGQTWRLIRQPPKQPSHKRKSLNVMTITLFYAD